MKKSIYLVFAVVVLLLSNALPGHAWERFRAGISVGPGGNPPPYPYYAQSPVVNEQQPPEYAQPAPQQEGQDYWYFCKDPQGYFPYVKQCPGGWLKVVPPSNPPEPGENVPAAPSSGRGTPPVPSIPADQETYGPPPTYTMPVAPQLVVIPGTYVYAVPDGNVHILFYRGFWWRPFQGRWYRAKFYNGPWLYVRSRMVPAALIALPGDYYLHISLGLSRIPYVELRDNWERWERERHWDRARERHEERWDHREGERERHF